MVLFCCLFGFHFVLFLSLTYVDFSSVVHFLTYFFLFQIAFLYSINNGDERPFFLLQGKNSFEHHKPLLLTVQNNCFFFFSKYLFNIMRMSHNNNSKWKILKEKLDKNTISIFKNICVYTQTYTSVKLSVLVLNTFKYVIIVIILK